MVMVVSNILFSNIQPVKGLQYAQNCNATSRSRCKCQSGRYCIMNFDAPYCEACTKYTPCEVGNGVSVPGTAPVFQFNCHLNLPMCVTPTCFIFVSL